MNNGNDHRARNTAVGDTNMGTRLDEAQAL